MKYFTQKVRQNTIKKYELKWCYCIWSSVVLYDGYDGIEP